LCEPLETTANGKRLVVEDSAACQKTLASPSTPSTLTWDNGLKWKAEVGTLFDENTPFTATGTTAQRNLVTRFSDLVNVKDFGAIGDGVADDTAAVQNAIASGQSIFFPNGTYNIASKILVSNKPVSIQGENQTSTILNFIGASAGIEITITSPDIEDSSFISNIKISKSNVSTTSPAISISGAGPIIHCWTYIENVNIYGAGGSYWYGGISLNGTSNASINSVMVDLNQTSSQYCFKISGSSFTNIFKDCQAFSSQNGWIIEGEGEGVNIESCTCVNCIVGILKDHGPSAGSEPLLFVTNSHINTNECGIRIIDGLQSFISGNLIYAGIGTTGPKTGWIGIDIGGTYNEDIIISQNIFNAIGYPTSNIGVSINQGNRIKSDSNIFKLTITANKADALSQNCTFINNTFEGVTNEILDLGTNNSNVYSKGEVLNVYGKANGLELIGKSTGLSPEIRSRGLDANINLKLQAKGSGSIQFGNHNAITTETLSGFIYILDDSGNPRKLAVVS
jgi:hypothetical protein